MSKVVANMSMSLDGFIADLSDRVEHLFGWYGNGDVKIRFPDSRWTAVTAANRPSLPDVGCR